MAAAVLRIWFKMAAPFVGGEIFGRVEVELYPQPTEHVLDAVSAVIVEDVEVCFFHEGDYLKQFAGRFEVLICKQSAAIVIRVDKTSS